MTKTSSARGVAAVGLVVLVAAASAVLLRAASLTTAFDAELQRLRGQWQARQQAEGLTGSAQRQALYAKYSTPELRLERVITLAPGGSASLKVSGRFTPDTTFLIDHDHVRLSGGTVDGSTYTATVTAAPDAVPGFGRLSAYAPVSGANVRVAAVFVGVPPSFVLTASNGWRVTVAPTASTFTVDTSTASVPYEAQYFKPGDATPFEKTAGTLALDAGRTPTDQMTLMLSSARASGAMQEFEALQREMADMTAFLKKSDKEQEAFHTKMEQVMERMMAEQMAAASDPAAAQRAQDAFGCSSIFLTLAGADVTGSIACGRDIGSLQVTGRRP